jgi:hypothetical protein
LRNKINKMNKIIITALAIVALVACNNAKHNDLTAQVDNLQKWVDSVKAANVVYDSSTWVALDSKYSEANASLTASELKEDEKAKLEATQKSWDEYKTTYIAKMDEAKKAAMPAEPAFNDEAKMKVAKNIFGEVTMTNTMDFSWVNASNILSTYNNFYEKFKANQATYNTDELAYIKALYEALDARKNEVEKEKAFKGSDNVKIAQTKVKFASLFAADKTEAKTEDK